MCPVVQLNMVPGGGNSSMSWNTVAALDVEDSAITTISAEPLGSCEEIPTSLTDYVVKYQLRLLTIMSDTKVASIGDSIQVEQCHGFLDKHGLDLARSLGVISGCLWRRLRMSNRGRGHNLWGKSPPTSVTVLE
ncbi:hypothetical protein RRG08_017505 [Elysia crispata]|uniref:Uncharacterized protein n=1 Tax=Elysia crispata TaxID=231223 RepID=A0AAE1DD55_9GAST|nr:hypothetical protein RRG08_017505 [Elysia crispata]